MDGALQNPWLELISRFLERWNKHSEIKGVCVVSLLNRKGTNLSVLKTGNGPEYSQKELRSLLLVAAESPTSGWSLKDSSRGYPLRHKDVFFGFGMVSPQVNGVIAKRDWVQNFTQLSEQMALATLPREADESALHSLARNLLGSELEEDEPDDDKLHWESSKTRAEIPVSDVLSKHLLLDDLPLF